MLRAVHASRIARFAWPVLLVALLAACGGAEDAPRAVAVPPGPFEYDRTLPLDVRVAADEDLGAGIRMLDLSYASPPGRVDAFLVVPEGEGPFPVALFQHGGGATRVDFVPEAIALAQRGAAALLVQTNERVGSVRQLVVDNVVAWRRGIDLLEERPELDAERLAMVGYSYGGGIAGLLAGAEDRIGSYVVAAGVAEWKGSGLPELAPPRHVRRARGAEFLFQAGRSDEVVPPEDVRRFYAAVRPPKEIVWYETGHQLGAQAQVDRVEWIARRLGLR